MRYLYSAFVLLLLASCGKEEKKPIDYAKTDWAFYKLKGDVKLISEKSRAAAVKDTGPVQNHENASDHNTDLEFNNDGMLVAEKKWMDDGKPFEELKYKGRDRKLEHIQFMNGAPFAKTTFEWDKTGKHNTAIVRSNPDNSLIERIETRYKGGNPVEKTTYNLQSNVIARVEYLYSNENMLMAENIYQSRDLLQYRNLYEYDDRKHKIAETKHDKNGSLLYKSTYEYNGDKVVSKNNFNEKNELDYYEKYAYDAKGNILDRRTYQKFDGSETRDEYKYDKNNNQTAWKISLNGKPSMEVMYTYDKHNNLTGYRYTDHTAQTSETKAYKMVYDKKGNWVKKTTLINNQPKFVIERKITYYE